MRKPLLTQTFSFVAIPENLKNRFGGLLMNIFILCLFSTPVTLDGQCNPSSGQITGQVFIDRDYDGEKGQAPQGTDEVTLFVYDSSNDLVVTAVPDANGQYTIDGLTDGESYRLNADMPDYLSSSIVDSDLGSSVRTIEVPACDVDFAVADPSEYCQNIDPQIAVTCFVKGGAGVNETMETVVFTNYLFNKNSPVSKIAMKGQTGSVFGTAWRSASKQLFLSSFIKQDAFLKDGPGAIYVVSEDQGQYETELWLTLESLGVDVGQLSVFDAESCDYGAQVGKTGIGGMEISGDEKFLFVVNLAGKSVVVIDIEDPSPATTMEIPLPDVGCQNGELRPFAIKSYKGEYYVTATCDASGSQDPSNHNIKVLTLDFQAKTFNEVFSTSFTREYWLDSPSNHSEVSHWLTDIEFTANGSMVLGVADRQSHRFCHSSQQLINQYPDVLMVWNDDGVWKLEDNGQAGSLTGSGVGNGQGPGGGEFFGEDYWILGPLYHPEIATGSLFSLPGSDDVVCTVFDPLYSTFAGGFHRYSTTNGQKTGVIQLYDNSSGTFGKGSGLGNVIDMCDPAPIQIGNLVWLDDNNNGIQDAGEQPAEDIELSLINGDCEVVATATTNARGEYYFRDMAYHSTYYVVITDPDFDSATGKISISNEEYQLTIGHGGTGIFQNEVDSDGEINSGTSCALIDGHMAVAVQTNGPGYVDHSFDLGLTADPVVVPGPDTFDLALKKEVMTTNPVKLGELVDFEITLFNQGQVAATEIQVVEYLPAGFEFIPMLNPGWIFQNGNLTFTYMGTLAPGSETSLTVTLQTTEGSGADDFVNYAEIVSAKDDQGQVRADIDSYPDMIWDNDTGGEPNGPTDNEYDDDGTIDEDDHDPAMVKIFDLALIKTTGKTSGVTLGEDVTFQITLYNQGTIAAKDIEVIDYLPEGLELSQNDNNGWVPNANGLLMTYNNVLDPGASVTLDLVLTVNDRATRGTLTNFSEIVSARDTDDRDLTPYDFDSTPDMIEDNDNGGQPGGIGDDMYLDHGAIDEDDHDPARLEIFDLALRKTVDKTDVSSTNEEITYTFSVFNQGNVTAKNIEVLDHIPDGFSFDPTANLAWQKVNDNLLRCFLTSPLRPGESADIPLVLTLSTSGLGQQLINIGEINHAEDLNGDQRADFDSTPDDNADNDAGGKVGTITDNVISGHGIDDEDDHDPAVVNGIAPVMLDVSLEKFVNKTHSNPGEEVLFTLEVTNEEATTVGQIRIADYLPFFLENIDPEWTLSGNGLYIYRDLVPGDGLPADGLKSGEVVTTTLLTKIRDNVPPGPILNTAEIAIIAAHSSSTSSADVDSNADADPNNDRSNNPKEVAGGAGANRPIEDDRGAAEVVVSLIERLDTCTCLNNEFSEFDGQFTETIRVTSASGETWYVQEANNIFRTSSPSPPSPPIPFGNDMLTETVLGGGISVYTIRGVFTEATPWYMVVRNNFDALFSVEGGQECRYDHPAIIGPNSVCVGGLEEYEIIPARPGAVYNWTIGSGGSIVSGNGGSNIVVQWDDAVSGPHRLRVTETSPDDCTAPATIEVEIGDQFVYSMSCVQNAQISLGNRCESVVTPQMLLTGGPYDYEGFNVMLSDEHGHPIPNATLTYEHIGQTVMAKVINACTGNSCWAWLTVEDKTGPDIICFQDTVDCTSMGQYPLPVAIDGCDADPVVHLLNESVEPIDCDRRFIKRVTRTYVAEDKYGNLSDTCTQEIMLRRINVGGIDYPDTFSIATGNPLLCNSFAADSNGLPLPEVTGVPMYEDVQLWPEEFYCSIGVDYVDIELQQIGCVRKFVREWRIVEWYCTRDFNLITYPQYIEITDTLAPQVVCPDVEYVVTNTRSCDADVWLELPDVSDNCSKSFRIDLVYPAGFIEDFQGGMVTLPVDTNSIKFRVYDECYNVDSCEFDVIVEDNTPPVAVCDQFTTVGLTDTGIAYIYAHTFDDGSYDNCDLKIMEVKRMDDGRNCGWVADTFGAYVEFCCEDVGQNVMVIFRVKDKSGNENTCMVEVEVQDKIPPRIYCPPNDTISCDYHYDTTDLSQFGEPVVLDNCEYTLTELVVENVDQCREGYIERVFIAEDGNNRTSCVQRIYIINEDPFDEDDITWPLDLDTTECREGFLTPDLLPDPYSYPKVDEDFCDLVGITFTDHTFPFVNNTEACYKIVRKWKIINWCRFDSSAYDTWTYEQVIKVQNETAPVFTSSCDPVEKCIFDDCDFGFIELFATATDDCTDDSELRWEYHVDLDSDGIVDYSSEGFGPRIDIAREFRLGEHNVRFVFEDRCGNKTVCTQDFDLVNCKSPTAYCKNGIVVDLIPMDLDGDGECDTEMVEIWAVDLDDNSFHPCDYPLTYSIGRDTSIKAITYDCDDLGRRELEICVTDPRGYQSCCNTFVIVQDNNMMDCCPTTFDKDCVIPPADVNLTDCMASLDPDDLMSFPMTTNCMVDSVVISFVDRDSTTGDVCQKIIRTWTVELYLGGVDTVCQFSHCITIDNDFDESDIIWPADTLMLDDCAIDLDTSVTGGTPQLIGEYCDYVTVDWSDVEIEQMDPACVTYQRTWSVVNACNNDETFTFEQIIEYKNQAPPSLTVPGDITVDADRGECSAFVTLPPVEFTECNTGVVITNSFNGGGANASGEYPVGMTQITFTAMDECGNISMGVTVVLVRDEEPPMLTCPSDVTFDCGEDLDDLDFGEVIASDNCGTVEILMDTIYDLNACNIGTITRNIVAQDESGNGAVCMQVITIDNTDPFAEGDITWPMDTVRISACDSMGPDNTGEPVIDTSMVSCFDITVTYSDTMFMDVCEGSPCTIIERTWTVVDSCQFDGTGAGVFTFIQVIIVDGEPLTLSCPSDTTITCESGFGDLSEYGSFSAVSECGLLSERLDTIYDLNVCDVGTVTRIYTAIDSAGTELTCMQTITIEIDDPFTEDRITWPQDSVRVGGCDSMEMAGEPMIDTIGLSCFNLSVTSEDTMYVDTCDGEPCDIIRRKWTVLDSCQLDGMGAGMYCDTQIIVMVGEMLTISCPPDTALDCTDMLGDLSRYGELTFDSPCGIDTVIRDTIYELNACSLGTVTRTLFVRDTVGNEAMCSHVITVGTDMPFDEMDITWPPANVFIDNCVSTDPDSLMNGRPEIDPDALECSSISISYVDSTASSCDMEPCLTIYRDWTVIDSCQDDMMGAGVFTFRQEIEVNDTTPPMFNVMEIDTVVYADTFTCEGDLTLMVSATDCSPTVIITNDSPFADSTGADASGTYPPGVTEFFFYAEDECCNRDSIPVTVELIDTFPPGVRCTKVFRTMFDSIEGVKFFATDPVIALSDNCTVESDIIFSFSLNDMTDTCRFYDCDSLRLTGGPNLLYSEKLYVWDEAGNVDSCDALLQVVDSSGCTKSRFNLNVSGLIATETDTEVRDVMVEMTGSGYEMDMTNDRGIYQFPPMPSGGSYVVMPTKDDDHMNGVTTKDLVYIQRHLLGMQELPTPYQRIAADINNSGGITAGDLAQLRRLLLGYYTEFPDNTSWRFVDGEYVFPDPQDPWLEVWPESYDIPTLDTDMKIDFTGIKIGDVTGDVQFDDGQISTRSSEVMVVEYELKDDQYHFYKASDGAINSFQFTLAWSPGDEVSVDVSNGSPMTEDDLGYHSLEYGLLTVASDDHLPSGRVKLFTIPQSAVDAGFELNGDITAILAYDEQFEQIGVVLKSLEDEEQPYALYQNRPNPFERSTIIGFELPFQQEARVTVLNVNGQVVFERDGLFDRGYNEVEIRDEMLHGSGIYYYRLDCEGFSKILKMINID